MFSCEFCKILKKTYFVEHLRAIGSAFWRSNNSKWYKKNLQFYNFTVRVFFWPCVRAPLTANLFFSYVMFYYTFYFSITLFPFWNFFSSWLVLLSENHWRYISSSQKSAWWKSVSFWTFFADVINEWPFWIRTVKLNHIL